MAVNDVSDISPDYEEAAILNFKTACEGGGREEIYF